MDKLNSNAHFILLKSTINQIPSGTIMKLDTLDNYL
jgi:hypothetical protein